ncbi:MAG: transporter substrate-binding domain-containing protein [Gemmatimonadota bacterium]|nr:transporter substrate-binding domain-containing protein [Gemmatimonadota bacterium]MDE2983135.1 transporter substrate-binding domain-containing protein [Gemmatimonadota bacterium]
MKKTRLFAVVVALTPLLGAACRTDVVDTAAGSCAPAAGDPVNVGFYAFFEPVSYSEDPDPASPGFANHLGYEADLLTALEAIEEHRLAFVREPVADWPGIWLLPATPEFDIVGGGITILESRTLDASGQRAVAFTSGHIAFRQSLLVRSEDAERFASYDNLTSDVRVGVLRDTTGEARLLQITGIANGDGVLARGARIETPGGTVVADGTARYTITAASASAGLVGRTHIFPPSDAMPQVVYLGDVSGEEELLAALRDGTIDAVARGEIGNGEAARASGTRFVVAAVDSLAEFGGFALDADDVEMLACIDERLEWLTDGRRIGYREWRADPGVFLTRAALWSRGREPTAAATPLPSILAARLRLRRHGLRGG